MAAWFRATLQPDNEVFAVDAFEEALVRVSGDEPDLIMVSLGLRGFDGLRLCSQLRSLPEGRNSPQEMNDGPLRDASGKSTLLGGVNGTSGTPCGMIFSFARCA